MPGLENRFRSILLFSQKCNLLWNDLYMFFLYFIMHFLALVTYVIYTQENTAHPSFFTHSYILENFEVYLPLRDPGSLGDHDISGIIQFNVLLVESFTTGCSCSNIKTLVLRIIFEMSLFNGNKCKIPLFRIFLCNLCSVVCIGG